MNYPIATKNPKILTKHDHERVDNYYWLNDRENTEVIDYLHAENAYTKHKLASTQTLQKELYDEIVAKIVKDDSSVPYESNGYWYYARYEDGKDYPLIRCNYILSSVPVRQGVRQLTLRYRPFTHK